VSGDCGVCCDGDNHPRHQHITHAYRDASVIQRRPLPPAGGYTTHVAGSRQGHDGPCNLRLPGGTGGMATCRSPAYVLAITLNNAFRQVTFRCQWCGPRMPSTWKRPRSEARSSIPCCGTRISPSPRVIASSVNGFA